MDSTATRTLPFVYKYKNHEGQDCESRLDITFPFDQENLEECITQLMALNQMDPMMRYLDENINLERELQKFVDTEQQNFLDDHAEKLLKQTANEELDIEAIVRDTERLYKEELLQFADRVGSSDEDIFRPRASIAWCTLRPWRTYSSESVHMPSRRWIAQINQLDITTTSEDINNLLAQQYTTQNYVRKRYESELEAMVGHQKNEYRNWITSQVSQMFQVSPVTTPLGNRSSMFVSQQPSMEESFTIHLGSQLKHMHNIRILSANVTELCSPLHAEESLNGLNMALGLYSSSLCGVVVLCPSIQAQANKNIIKNANKSTEFHFEQIDVQMEKIEKQIKNLTTEDSSGSSTSNSSAEGSATPSPTKKSVTRLKTGDFFITKHSNLSQTHVIFHLISDEPINSPSEINSRHPVILGLRNILKTASRHDITTLTIPALLRHEMSEDMTVQWCIRRAELVFKCAKGFMIESASWGGAELSTLQLLLPDDISESLFTTLAGMVPSVFHVANPKILVDTSN
ncbi:GM16386 [Drosophila sechellia]|uniref:GM16386 n=1 Tax=Drosophila sechellia TaxID=7238 RepID=B4IH21_DROSE|nr:GM16386 [Drosophila sechellia]